MTALRVIVTSLVLCLGVAIHLAASGRVGFYGIVEKVVFEPNEQSPQRMQVWGAFAYADGGAETEGAASTARRGYLYFRLPAAGDPMLDAAKTEWRDLKAVAGNGQAVGFGSWGYIGHFEGLDPNAKSSMPPYILELYPGRGVQTDLRVRPASEAPSAPAVYQTNVGIVKLPAQGSRRDIVKQLQDVLRKP